MNLHQELKVIAGRLSNDADDTRHTLLDVSARFLDATFNKARIPEPLRDEVAELRRELDEIQPRFPSHRNTSVLFDREALGAAGRKRAKEIALRIVSVAKSLDRIESSENG